MYKCSVCKSDTKYDEFSDYENEMTLSMMSSQIMKMRFA
jgi:hypothetical protein